MRAVIQRVSRASVTVDGEIIGKIDKGSMILLGVSCEDDASDLDYLVKKITAMRIFEDENEKMNLSVSDVNGSLLVVSQFTLMASTKKGNRPSFTEAGAPQMSETLYEKFISRCQALGLNTQHGQFGAHMQVDLINDGPVTIIIDSRNRT